MIDHQTGLNPGYAQRTGEDWVVADSGKKPKPRAQEQPVINSVIDAANRAYQLREMDKETISHLKEVSLTDDLTGCYNTRYFIRYATEEFDVNRDNNRIAIVNIDINGLKPINDILGHVKGDTLLNNFVAYMRSQLRKGDILVRVGGDEFLIICENIKNDHDFEKNLQKRMDKISNNAPKSSIPEENISFAHGVTVFRKQNQRDLYDTRAISDALMYQRKREMKGLKKTEEFISKEIDIIPTSAIIRIIKEKIRSLFKGE